MLFNVSTNNYYYNNKSNKIFTPTEVVQSMFYLLDKNIKNCNFEPKYCLEPNFGKGAILKELQHQYYKSNIVGVEIDKHMTTIIQKKYIEYDNVNIINNDFLSMNFHDIKFDLIIANPPFSIESNDGKIIKATWLSFLKKSFELLSDNGKMVYILPNYWCLNTPKNIIKYLKHLPSINFIPLPKSIFYENSIPCQIVIFDKNNKDMFLYNTYKKLYPYLFNNNKEKTGCE